MSVNISFAAIDQGTTGTRVVVFDEFGNSTSSQALIHQQITPQNGWVEHDAQEILSNIMQCLAMAGNVAAIGLSHQGESVVAWNAQTGIPIYNAIIWQDMRTEDTLQQLKKQGFEDFVRMRSGLPLDAYFSASKMGWIIENVPEAKLLAIQGKLRLATMDAFFLDRMCGEYSTDYNTASRTSLFNVHTMEWDIELCELFGVPIQCLPPVRENIGDLGAVNINGKNIPMTASIVDQFAGIYGHGCRKTGDAKATFGTGAFLQCLTSSFIKDTSSSGLLPTLCWKFPNEAAVFGLDGGVYNAASAINWAKSIGLFSDFAELNNFSKPPAINRGLAFVPALSGLACPYWDRSAAGLWAGLSLEIDRSDMLQSILEGIAVRAAEVILAMDSISPLGETISVDGGLSVNPYFRQFLASILNKNIVTSENQEVTALGTALLARKGLGINAELNIKQALTITEPQRIDRAAILQLYKKIIARSRDLRPTGE